MVIVPQTGDRLGKQNPAYGLLQHTRIKPNAAALLWSMAQRRPIISDLD